MTTDLSHFLRDFADNGVTITEDEEKLRQAADMIDMQALRHDHHGCRLCVTQRAEAADALETQQAEIDRLKAQAADDIIWMSGIGPIPDEGQAVWGYIQRRWLR